MTDDVLFLAGASEQQRTQWFSRRSDAGANNCLGLAIGIRHLIGDGHPERHSLAVLYLWLLRYGQSVGWFSAVEATIRVAAFAAEMHNAGHGDELAMALPSADRIVTDCLDQIPISLADVPEVRDLAGMTVGQMRQSRTARNLVSAGLWHADRITDADLARRLKRWSFVLPQLV